MLLKKQLIAHTTTVSPSFTVLFSGLWSERNDNSDSEGRANLGANGRANLGANAKQANRQVLQTNPKTLVPPCVERLSSVPRNFTRSRQQRAFHLAAEPRPARL